MSTLVGVVVTGVVASVLAIAASTGITALVANDPKPPQGYVKNDVPVYGER